ncbi:MAG: chromate transporter [Marvinbryantia sp.]|jgi:chromate transporter
MMVILQLFWEFFKTGLFSIGGGMATIPFLQSMSVKTGWFTSGQLADMIAVAESTPGPLGVNMATYVGYTVGNQHFGSAGGILTAIVATIGLVTPSIIVILIIAQFLKKFRENKYVDAAFYGLRPASVGLIAAAGVSIVLLSLFGVENVHQFIEQAHVDWRHLALAAVILVLTRWTPKVKDLHPIYFIIFSAIVGIVFHFAV